jgi:hypothetical protein
MQVQAIKVVVQKSFDSRRHALNTFEALYPSITPALFSTNGDQGEEIYVAQYEKIVALIEGVEYSVLTVEDPKEGIENAE